MIAGPRVRIRCLPALIGLAISLGAVAAAEEKAIVARIGEDEIDRATFEAEFADTRPDTTKTQGEARRDLLEALVNRHLLALAARDAGMFKPDSVTERRLRNYESSLIFRKMRELEIRSKVKLTDADVEEFYAKQAIAFDVSQIVVATEDEAKEVMARLAAGADFAALADSASLDVRTAGKGGRLPLFVWGTTSLVFLRELETMQPGEVRGPLRSDAGYHVILLNAKVPRPDRPPLAEVRDFMTERLRVHTEMQVAGAYYAELDRRYHFTPNWESVSELARRFKAALDEAAKSNPAGTAEEQAGMAMQSIVLPESLLAQAVATWDFGSYSVREEWTELQEMPPLVLVDRKNPHYTIEDAASGFRSQAMIREGRARGLDQDPEVQRRLELRREELVVTEFYRSSIMDKATFSEAEEREYYASHEEKFDLPARAKVATIQYRDRTAAEEMEAALRHPSGNPDSVLAAHKTRGVTQAENQEIWIGEADHPILFERAQTLKPGEVARVIDEEGSWTVLILLEQEEAKKLSFEEARKSVQESLRNLRSNEILDRTLTEIKVLHPVCFV
jgi:hypothetical protein